jgi:DegV family protein with EDD domain
MRKIKIIADSTCDLNPETLRALDIEVIPLLVLFGDKEYRDGENITLEQLYQNVQTLKMMPRTAAVSPAAFIERFKVLIDQDYDIFFTGLGSTLSGTYQAALIAATEFPKGRIRIVDSLNLSTSSGLLILKACKLRDEGKSLDEIADEIQRLVPKVYCSFAVETLEYLYKGGRCSRAKFYVGTLLRAHPIIKVTDGKLDVYKTPKGKMVKALDVLVEDFKKFLPDVDMDHIMITHSIAPEGLKYLTEELSKLVDPKCLMITRAGCVIASHCGPNTIGILFIRTK